MQHLGMLTCASPTISPQSPVSCFRLITTLQEKADTRKTHTHTHTHTHMTDGFCNYNIPTEDETSRLCVTFYVFNTGENRCVCVCVCVNVEIIHLICVCASIAVSLLPFIVCSHGMHRCSDEFVKVVYARLVSYG